MGGRKVVDRPKQLGQLLVGGLPSSVAVAVEPPAGAGECAVQMAVVFGYRFEVGQRPLVGIEGNGVDDRRPRAAFVSRRQRVGDPAACAAESTDDELRDILLTVNGESFALSNSRTTPDDGEASHAWRIPVSQCLQNCRFWLTHEM